MASITVLWRGTAPFTSHPSEQTFLSFFNRIRSALLPDKSVGVVLGDVGLQVEHHLLPQLHPVGVLLAPAAVLLLKFDVSRMNSGLATATLLSLVRDCPTPLPHTAGVIGE